MYGSDVQTIERQYVCSPLAPTETIHAYENGAGLVTTEVVRLPAECFAHSERKLTHYESPSKTPLPFPPQRKRKSEPSKLDNKNGRKERVEWNGTRKEPAVDKLYLLDGNNCSH